ncbi:hypothetical protein ALI144C_07515 [Actinosynnema sp. ALI-1.44]|uniref:ArsR/SmtB family transcription factor n=1 Tax=Actinosynnema sp. ALI-1.44 TaxID=1933779 RepID=UPI00097BD259|nr:winged helix-turn-helix domain-containing protein [Actinosynnema sp. ALI-1.44]ONI88277.1 hypothetical protein ALI144C_07515 [Actinosynnema sp. ALI-1.44]
MLRIHFTARDIAEVRLGGTLGPVAETLFALDMLHRPDDVLFREWRRQVRGRLGGHANTVLRLIRSVRPVPDLLWMLRDETRADDTNAALLRRQISSTVRRFHQIAIAPYWGRIHHYLTTVHAANGQLMISGGVDRLLRGFTEDVSWAEGVLEIPAKQSGEVRLDGRGLLICPSLFLTDRQVALIDAGCGDGIPTLVFAASPDRPTAADLWDVHKSNGQALAALVGRTRAAVLQSLVDGCSTGEMARRLRISSAGASQHAAVLRGAGLITSHRRCNTVLHTLTPLGVALLGEQRYGAEPVARPVSLAG